MSPTWHSGITQASLIMFSLDISPRRAMDKLADENSKWVTVRGTQIHYKDEGKGTVVVLLHNSLMYNGVWDEWIQHFPNGLRIIRPDIPGFGLTGPTPDEDYSMQSLTDFVGEFLDELKLYSVCIIGFSMGAQLAWRYAAKSPNRINKMVLINPTGYPEKELPDVFKLARSWKGNILRFIGSRNLLKSRIGAMCNQNKQPTPEFFEKLITSQRRQGNRAASLRFMREPSDLLFEKIKTIKIPTQIQWSLHPQPQRFSTDMTNSELVTLDNLGHFPVLEDPAYCAKVACEFLTAKQEVSHV